jgi:nucleotide-binding universal stress UspA family protein
MYRSILVPLDGTAFGEHALPMARTIARRFGSTLSLVHVDTTATEPSAGDRAYLERVASLLEEQGMAVTTELIRGPLTESLERFATERGTDLVVACTHCHEGISRFWHRGVAERLLQDMPIPILLVRSPATPPVPSRDPRLRHILIPLDGSPFAEEILDMAVPLGRGLGAEFTLLRVVRPTSLIGYTLLEQDLYVNQFLFGEQEQEARAYLNRVAERLRAAGLAVAARVAVDDDPARAIVNGARPDNELGLPPADLVAMTTHSRGPLARLVLSSVTDRVLHQAPVPLLLHHPQAEEQAEPAVVIGRMELEGLIWHRI